MLFQSFKKNSTIHIFVIWFFVFEITLFEQFWIFSFFKNVSNKSIYSSIPEDVKISSDMPGEKLESLINSDGANNGKYQDTKLKKTIVFYEVIILIIIICFGYLFKKNRECGSKMHTLHTLFGVCVLKIFVSHKKSTKYYF